MYNAILFGRVYSSRKSSLCAQREVQFASVSAFISNPNIFPLCVTLFAYIETCHIVRQSGNSFSLRMKIASQHGTSRSKTVIKQTKKPSLPLLFRSLVPLGLRLCRGVGRVLLGLHHSLTLVGHHDGLDIGPAIPTLIPGI